METTPTPTTETPTAYDAAISDGGPVVYDAGFRYVLLGKRGRAVHAITKNGKTRCNGTVVSVLDDRVFTTFSEAMRAADWVFCKRENY